MFAPLAARSLGAALLIATASLLASRPALAEPSAGRPAEAKTSRPDVPGETVIAPSRRQSERRALRALLAERQAKLSDLQVRAASAPAGEQAALQMSIEQHKRATRLALLDRQLAFAAERGDLMLVRRLEMQRARAASLVTAPLQNEVAR